jgi:signal transduction histidine kinase
MHSITERAAELGGTARYDRAASGCRLLVTLPLATSTGTST